MAQLVLCHQWFRYWFYTKQTLLPEQIRIEFFIQKLGLNPRCWLIIKLASIFQSHIYPLDSACLSIGTFTLASRCCHWNCTKPLLGECRGVYCLLYIPGKVYNLHYDVMVNKYFQHYSGRSWGKQPVDSPQIAVMLASINTFETEQNCWHFRMKLIPFRENIWFNWACVEPLPWLKIDIMTGFG